LNEIISSQYDPIAAFRLPAAALKSVDAICKQQDLTRSQLLRRLINQYLRKESIGMAKDQAASATPAEPEFEKSQHF
jgi:hypothetical protein